MATLASSLLDFILSLFRDPEAAAAFEEDPHRALADAGLGDVDPSDVHALMPVVTDYSPVATGSPVAMDHGQQDHRSWAEDHEDDHCRNDDHQHSRPARHDEHDHDRAEHEGRSQHDHPGQEAAVFHEVRYVENNYTYSDTEIDLDASHSVWVSGDAQAIFGDDNVVAGADGVALGEEAELDVHAENLVAGNENVVGNAVDIEDSGNTSHVSGNGNAVGEDSEVTTTVDTDVQADTLVTGDHNNPTETDVQVEDSYNPIETEDSFNTLEVADSFNEETNEVTNEETNQETEVAVEDSFNEETQVEGSAFVAVADDPVVPDTAAPA